MKVFTIVRQFLRGEITAEDISEQQLKQILHTYAFATVVLVLSGWAAAAFLLTTFG